MERHPALKSPARGVLPVPVIVLIVVALVTALFLVSRVQVTKKHQETNKAETVTKVETSTRAQQKDQTAAGVTYAEFDTGRRTRTAARKWDRNTRTTTKTKTTHYAAGVPDTVTEEETVVDDISSKNAAVEDKTETGHEAAAVTNVTKTTDTTVITATTDQTKATTSHEVKTETKAGSRVTGRAGLAITTGKNPAITWDVFRVGKYSAQTILEISSKDAALNAGGAGISRDLTNDGRFFGGSNVLYGKRDGLKVGAHIGVRF